MYRDLSKFPTVMPIEIRWGDMDAFGHVNNTNFIRYFECARIRFFEELKLTDFMQGSQIGIIVASVSCKFIAPLYYPDTVEVGALARNIGEDRFDMDYAIFSKQQQRICAVGTSLVVCYDYGVKKKAAIPEQLKPILASSCS